MNVDSREVEKIFWLGFDFERMSVLFCFQSISVLPIILIGRDPIIMQPDGMVYLSFMFLFYDFSVTIIYITKLFWNLVTKWFPAIHHLLFAKDTVHDVSCPTVLAVSLIRYSIHKANLSYDIYNFTDIALVGIFSVIFFFFFLYSFYVQECLPWKLWRF